MIDEAQTTVRNIGGLLIQRALHAASGFVFAILVPRLMGPDIYGRYSLLTSLYIWLVLFGNLGFNKVMGRYVPQFILQQDKKGLRSFIGNLLAIRFLSGALTGSLYFAATVLWLRDIDPLVLLTVAAAVFVRIAGELLFDIFLGLNQASRWQVGETLRQWLSLLLLLPGFYLGGLQGAVLALLLTEIVVSCLGIYWTRPHVDWSSLHLNVQRSIPYLRFALGFFASDVLSTALGASGEISVRIITADYAQVAYFGLAYRIFTTILLTILLLTLSFTPLLSMLLTQGRIQLLKLWAERLLKYLLIGGVLAVFGVLFLADDLVPPILGASYQLVADNLLPLTLSLLAVAVGNIARLLAIVYAKPKAALIASAIRLGAFWLLAVPLIALFGSWGACVAMLLASVLYTG